MKIRIGLVALIALAGCTWAQEDDITVVMTNLKDAVSKKDVEGVKKLSASASKLAKAVIDAAPPAEKAQSDYAKDVENYSEYALSAMAIQSAGDPATVIGLTEALMAQSPKSRYLDDCTSAYLAALGKQGGAAKQLEGAAKLVAGKPDDGEALAALAQGYSAKSPDRALGYSTKLIAVMKVKAKPEGVSDADWEKQKGAMLGQGYYLTGALECGKQSWVECDRDLRAGLAYIKDQSTLGNVYFYLGLANYQVAKVTNDRPKMQAAQKYSDQSAAIAGPMQQQAARNSAAIKQELAAPIVRR